MQLLHRHISDITDFLATSYSGVIDVMQCMQIKLCSCLLARPAPIWAPFWNAVKFYGKDLLTLDMCRVNSFFKARFRFCILILSVCISCFESGPSRLYSCSSGQVSDYTQQKKRAYLFTIKDCLRAVYVHQ